MTVILQCLVFTVNIIITFCKTKHRMLFMHFIVNLLTLFTYIVNGNYEAAILYVITVIRPLLFMYKDNMKTNLLCYITIVIQIIIALFTFTEPLDLFNLTAGVYSCYYMWFYNTANKLRIGLIINNLLRIVYEAHKGLYILVIIRIITILTSIFNNRKAHIK